MCLKENLNHQIKQSLVEGDKERVKVLRLITSSIKQQEVDNRIVLDDDQILLVLDKMIKQRRDSLNQYKKANRQDLADKEIYEIEIISKFMPEPFSEEEVLSIVEDVLKEVSATSMKDMGKVVGLVKNKVQGRADMAHVSQIIKSKLS